MIKNNFQFSNLKNGYILVLGLIIMAIVTMLGVSLVDNVSIKVETQKKQINSDRALVIAEAGLQKAIYELNQNPLYSGEQNTSFANGKYSIAITNINPQKKYIEATGQINDGSNIIYKKVGANVNINTDNISFYYAVQAGQGGFKLSNNATINGSVYSNGSIKGESGARITGDAWVAGAGELNIQAQNTTYENGFYLGRNNFGRSIAQSFSATITQPFAKASFYIKKTGSPPNATVTLRPYSNGMPLGQILAQGTLYSNLVTSQYSWVDVTFDQNPLLISGEIYWLTIEMPSTSTTKYYTIGISDNIYEGDAMALIFADWEDIYVDFNFKVFSGLSQTFLEKIIVGKNAYAYKIKDANITQGAYYQVIENSTAGAYYPNSAPPPLQNFPISDGQIAEWISDAQAGGTIEGDYNPSQSISLGPKKINGNFTLSGNKTLTITGTIYVTGNINLNNNAIVKLDSSFGNNSGIIIAEGKINLSNNVQVQKINNTGYVMFISKYNQPSDYALEFGNNVTGGIYFAPYGQAQLNNNTNIIEINAYTIKLNNNVSINYEQGLANVQFSSGSGASWTLEKGSWSILQ